MAAAAGGGGGGGAPPPAPAPAPAAAAAACAACKYQRRRCAADCPLAPYFPYDRPRVFRNAHRLFGVSNILKTLERAGPDPERRHEAMQCVVYESQAWDLYPSAGCVPIIHGLQQRIRQAEHELRRVHADLQAYRRRADADDAAIVVVAHAQGEGGAKAAMSSSSSPPAPPPFQLQLQWTAAAMGGDDEGIAAAATARSAPFMYGGGGDEQQQMMINNAVTSDDGNIIAAVAPPPPPQTLPSWTMQPPQSYEHPFFVNATTMVPQRFDYQQQPVGVSTQLPELQDDMVNYFADGINGENDQMPRESSTDSSGEKAMRNAPKMKDNDGFIK